LITAICSVVNWCPSALCSVRSIISEIIT
jgi:hypothetical protein